MEREVSTPFRVYLEEVPPLTLQAWHSSGGAVLPEVVLAQAALLLKSGGCQPARERGRPAGDRGRSGGGLAGAPPPTLAASLELGEESG